MRDSFRLFQISLTSHALTWFIKLDMTKVLSWENLVGVFIAQHKSDIKNSSNQFDL